MKRTPTEMKADIKRSDQTEINADDMESTGQTEVKVYDMKRID